MYNIFDNLHRSTCKMSIKHVGTLLGLIRSSSENPFKYLNMNLYLRCTIQKVNLLLMYDLLSSKCMTYV